MLASACTHTLSEPSVQKYLITSSMFFTNHFLIASCFIIFSDFMHHTSEYSFYNTSDINIKKFTDTRYFKNVYSSLRDNVDVELYCYKRYENGQCDNIESFWNKYFQEIDAHNNNIKFSRIGS